MDLLDPSLVGRSVGVGCRVAVRWKDDGRFYRALIREVIPEEDTIKVTRIDHGDQRVIRPSLRILYHLPPETGDVEPTVVHCALRGWNAETNRGTAGAAGQKLR